MRSGIYRIVCMVSGKSYIGQSANIDGRIFHHYKTLIAQNHKNKHLQSAYNLYGAENFVAEVIEFCDKDVLTEREQRWIDHYGLDNLYNICPKASSQLGVKRSEETKQKMAENARRQMTGSKRKPFTEEHRANMRKNHVGLTGRKHSEETRKKLSEAAKLRYRKG